MEPSVDLLLVANVKMKRVAIDEDPRLMMTRMKMCDEVESDFEEANPVLDKADELYSRLHSRDISVKQAIDDPIFTALEKCIRDKTNEIKQSRTAKLWHLFSEMVAILKRFLVVERTGDWQLHLSTLQEMMPYYAAAVHNLYAKSVYLYLSQMQDLDRVHPETVVNKADDHTMVVYGEDPDLLVLLCHYAKEGRQIFFTTDKQTSMKNHRVGDISKAKSVLGSDSCRQLLFIHALTGCDTTSRLHGIGKPAALKKIMTDIYLKSQGAVFLQENSSKEDIIKAGEEALVNLYGGVPLEGLDILRLEGSGQKQCHLKGMLWSKCSHFHQHLMLPYFIQCEFTYSVSTGKANQWQILILQNEVGLLKLANFYLLKCPNHLHLTSY
uniref:Uncharacterized protein n=1 Tax=Magallana gigas TaxID=29159 RepID=K1QFC5_MAGGI